MAAPDEAHEMEREPPCATARLPLAAAPATEGDVEVESARAVMKIDAGGALSMKEGVCSSVPASCEMTW